MATETFGVFVQALSNLQDVHGSSSFSLPKEITVGNQGAGKSSVIERMVGKLFLPRGKGIKTRCAIHVGMHQTTAGSKEYALFKPDSTEQAVKEFTDFSEVCTEIERRTDNRTNNSKNISREENQLDIFSPTNPDLHFVDLPGFTKIAVDSQDEDIEQQILDRNLP